MRNFFVILITLFVVLAANSARGEPTWQEMIKTGLADKVMSQSEESEPEERQLTDSRMEFKESCSRGSIGRFQAIMVNRTVVFILDTKEGHTWEWRTDQKGPIYTGQALPD